MENFRLADILRAAASGLEIPIVAILILLLLAAAALVGWLIAELLTERRHLKIKLPALLEDLRAPDSPITDIISASGLLKSQKDILLELTSHPDFSATMREALAIRLIEQEQSKYDKILKLSELIVRLGPLFGLLGTLIPLGPGIIALGQGDTYTLSTSLLTAFDTTIAGLVVAAVASVVSAVRRTWYKDYMSILEVIATIILETVASEVPS